MRVCVLGSGTLRPSSFRGGPALWIEAGEARVLLDCGSGTLRTMARFRLPWERISHLCLSHFHTDHVAEVAPLLFALKHGLSSPRRSPLWVVGPLGTRDHLEQLARAHGSYILDPGFPVHVVELGEGRGWEDPSAAFRVRVCRTPHTEDSLAFRLEAHGGDLGFTGDTGPAPQVGEFLQGCRLLVAECSQPDGSDFPFHLSPSSLAQLALRALPELLVTVHVYPPLEPCEVPALVARAGYPGRVMAGWDGLVVDWTAGLMHISGEGG